MSDEKTMGHVIQIDKTRIRDHLGEIVRGTVEETLGAMLDAELTSYAAQEAMSAAKPARIPVPAAMNGHCRPGPVK